MDLGKKGVILQHRERFIIYVLAVGEEEEFQNFLPLTRHLLITLIITLSNELCSIDCNFSPCFLKKGVVIQR